MKYIKMMGLAVVAAMAVMAMAGAGTASANGTACTTNTSPCTSLLANGTKLSAQLKSGTHATLTSSLGNVTCKKSTVGGVINNASTAHGEITSLTFTECTLGSTACTVKATAPPYTVTGVASNQTLTITQKTGGNVPGALVECGSFINCTFSNSDITLGFTGGTPAFIKAEAVSLNRSGGFCPSTSTWHAEYEVTSPKTLFLTV